MCSVCELRQAEVKDAVVRFRMCCDLAMMSELRKNCRKYVVRRHID
jgi:hypothetical protein